MNGAIKTKGFGVPDVVDPHHFVVTIPSGKNGNITIVEHFGVSASNENPDVLVRCRLSRTVWRSISEEVRRVLNDRLREKGLKPSRWVAGENPVERLLGKEVCVLAWAVENAPEETHLAAIACWLGFKPEERWWLFKMVDQTVGDADDGDKGWRKALRIALTESPSQIEASQKKRHRVKYDDGDLFPLPLFDVKDK
jgi:hypothetical protein